MTTASRAAAYDCPTSVASFPERPDEQGFCQEHPGPGIRTGRDGRFRVEGLVPGLKYGASAARGIVVIGDLSAT